MQHSQDRIVVSISPRGQVTLPVTIRKALGLRPSDVMLVSVENGVVVLMPAHVVPHEGAQP